MDNIKLKKHKASPSPNLFNSFPQLSLYSYGPFKNNE